MFNLQALSNCFSKHTVDAKICKNIYLFNSTMPDRKTRRRTSSMSTTVRGGGEVLITRNAINEVYRSFSLLIRSVDAMTMVEEVTCGIYVPIMGD